MSRGDQGGHGDTGVSNIVEFKRGSSQRDITIVIKANNCAVKSCCSICGICDRENSPFDAYLDEPGYHWVCGQCLEQHEFKGYARCLEILNNAAYFALHETEAAKEVLEHVKGVLEQAWYDRNPRAVPALEFKDADDGDGEGIPF